MQKIVKFNRAFLYCCLVAMFCLSPLFTRSEPLQGKPLTISIKNTSLAEVLRQVSKKSGVYIYFQDADLSSYSSVSIDVKNKPVDVVLHELLDGRGLSWVEVDKNSIAIRRKEVVSSNENYTDTAVSTITVSGKVVDEKGSPIPGATVLIRGGKTGTTTNQDGGFLLRNVQINSLINVSSIGYLTSELPIHANGLLGTIKLKEFVGNLDETVVIAYGSTTKRFSTGNINTINGDVIKKQPVGNPLLALQGRVPGLLVTQSTGFSGGGVRVLIQGQNSIAKGNDPFYVVDGVPYTSQLLPNYGGVLGVSGDGDATNGSPFNFINPSDIESITILKDADATAIYGSRAANGAILITTKKGTVGKTSVDFNLQRGWGDVSRKLDLLSTKEFLQMRREAIKNDGLTIDPDYDYDLTLWDTTRYTDWQKTLIGGTAQYTNINANVSGGNALMQYIVGGTYHRETTVFPGDFADWKGSMHFNVNSVSTNNKFHVTLSGNYLIDNNQLPNGDLTLKAVTLSPDAPKLYKSDGSLNWEPTASGSSTWTNPLSNLNNTYQNKTSNLISNMLLSYSILPDLEIKSSFGYTNLQSNEIVISPLTSRRPEARPRATRTANYANNNINSWIVEPQVSYHRIIGNGKLDALIGTTFQQKNSNGQRLSGRGYNDDAVMKDIQSAASVSPDGSLVSIYKYNAIFGRISYNLNSKYLINITARRDGSSRFGSANKFHNFGALGLGWIFSQEAFIQKYVPFLSFGKIRGSYGTTGNDQIGDYLYQNLYTATRSDVAYQGSKGLAPTGLTNPYLQWEETKKLQFGLNLGFFKDRVLFDINYFQNRSSNQLVLYTLPIITGFGSITRNFPAIIQNTGWEISLQTANIKSEKFNWTSSFNITLPENKLVSFPDLASSSSANSLVIGQSINLIKSFHYGGVDPKTGVYQFITSKGDLTSNPDYFSDRTVLINASPKFYGGLQNSFSYKNFELDLFFQFVKQKGPSYKFGNQPGNSNGYAGNQPKSVLDRWQKTNDIAPQQRFNSDYTLFDQWANAASSDAGYTDASYIRLKNISLAWQLPDKWKGKIGVKSTRVYVQAQNLFTITNYIGLDPETKSSIVLPPLRVITMGIQMTL